MNEANTAMMTKNATIFRITVQGFMPGVESPFLSASTMERTMMPMMSSKIAAATMVLPTLVFSLPSSLSVATVTLTEVAVEIAP